MQADQDKQYAPPVSKSRLNKKFLVLVIFGSLCLIALYFLAPVLTVVYLIQPVRVEGHAMAPTLNHGDKIFIQKMFGELNRGDIVVFLYPHDQSKSYIKRIIGLPGETLDIKNGKVIVNGKQLDEPYIDSNNASFDTMPRGCHSC
jgi:signal peptidase I